VQILFWFSLSAIFVTYFGYPLLLLLQSFFFPKSNIKESSEKKGKSVSVIIAARDEEAAIGKRLINLLDQDYSGELIELVIVSDGSKDGTEEKINEVAAQAGEGKITLIPLTESIGKASAINAAVQAAKGELLVFTDSRQTFEKDVIRQLAANFADPEVGCVSGELKFVDSMESQISVEMGLYWRYEKFIRKLESCTGSVVGATGAIYAMRRELFVPLPAATLLDDVLTPLNVALQGQRVLYDPSAVAFDLVSKNVVQEWRRKVRTLTGNWQLFSLKKRLLFPSQNPLFIRFFLHKIARLLVPYFLVALFVSSCLQSGLFFKLFAAAQLLCYLCAVAGLLFPQVRQQRFVNLCYFFVVLNYAAVVGFFKWITGNSSNVWHSGTSGRGLS